MTAEDGTTRTHTLTVTRAALAVGLTLAAGLTLAEGGPRSR